MTGREHAPPSGENTATSGPEPSYAERARTLVHLGRVGTLATVSERHPEWPFGSVMPYGVGVNGSPTFLISTMAMHTRNVLRDPRASLLVMETGAEADPLGAGRVTLMGRVIRTPEKNRDEVRADYLARYENASYWVDFKDFAFFQMEILDVYFVGGFGVMGWVTAEEYSGAEPDPLADASRGIIEHMNEDHADSLALLARAAAGVEGEEARMTAVDRFGFHVRLRTREGMKGLRIPFLREARNPEETRQVLVHMVREAREK